MDDIAWVDKAPAVMLPLLVAIAVAQETPTSEEAPAQESAAQEASEQEPSGQEASAPEPSAPVDTPVHPGRGPQLTGYLQLWGTAWDMDEDPQADSASYGDPEDDVGFKFRRVRIGLNGTQGKLDYVVTIGTETTYDALDPASEAVSLEDAIVVLRPDESASITVGLQKVPVGREQLVSSTRLVLAERAVLSQWLVPGHDVGVTGKWETGVARVRLGVYNGNGSILGDDNLGMLFAARVELALAGASKWADVYRTWGRVEDTTLGIAIDGYDNMDLATHDFGGGIDAMIRTGMLAVLLEARTQRLVPADTSVDVPEVPSTTTRLGALAQVGVTFAAWEPAVRVSWFDDATALEDNGDTAEVTAGMTVHSKTDALRVGGGYVARLELAGEPLANDTARLWFQLAL